MKKLFWRIAEFFEAVSIKCDEASNYFRDKSRRNQTELTEENFERTYHE